MDEEYLGDSYDLVKRFLGRALSKVAKLYAHQDFIPTGIQEKYFKLTKIPILPRSPKGRFGILLDPDTGVTNIGSATRRYVPLQFIVDLQGKQLPHYIVCYDQSFHRKRDPKRKA
jgi:hypothetical protein